MEMMVVLLIMSIIAAATAPIVSRKMTRSSGTGASPWVFTGQGKNIAFNMAGSDNVTAIIGATKVPDGTKTRLYIDCGDSSSQLALGRGDQAASILADPVGRRVAIYSANSTGEIPNDTVSFGMGQTLNGKNLVAIGSNVNAGAEGATGIGSGASAGGSSSTAIGYQASATGSQSTAVGSYSIAAQNAVAIGGGGSDSYASAQANAVAIGSNAVAANDSIAIGKDVNITGSGSIVIGNNSKAEKANSIVIGNNVTAKGDNQIVLGTKDDTIYIPGNIVVGKSAYLGADDKNATIAMRIINSSKESKFIRLNGGPEKIDYWKTGDHVDFDTELVDYWKTGDHIDARAKDGSWSYWKTGDHVDFSGTIGTTGPLVLDADGTLLYVFGGLGANTVVAPTNGVIPGSSKSGTKSDRRLKNVGDKFTKGLEALKKLDFYHFTFKDDETKTPHVGVMAQDLQKVFPDAVTKGDDGYLRIRFEDMFYAVINAVKELDCKINELSAQVKTVLEDIVSVKSKNNEQDKIIEEQQKLIEVQQEAIKELQKRVSELEKKA